MTGDVAYRGNGQASKSPQSENRTSAISNPCAFIVGAKSSGACPAQRWAAPLFTLFIGLLRYKTQILGCGETIKEFGIVICKRFFQVH